jgi:signal transduction histidine kinase/CheY-like chemotaxis protein
MDHPQDEHPAGHRSLLLKELFRAWPEAPPEVLRRQIAIVHRNLPAALVVNVIVALFLGSLFRSAGLGWAGTAWVAAIVALCVARIVDARIHRALTLDLDQLARARRNLRLAAASQGILWGVAGILALPQDPLQQVVVLAMMACLTAGAHLTLAPVWSTYALFLVPALVPISCRLLGSGVQPLVLLGAMGLGWGCLMLTVTARTSRWLEDSLLAARDNRTLLGHLRTANDALVEYHAKLETTVAERTQSLRAAVAQAREERRRDRERDEASARARRLDGLGQLAGGIAHDFNNLLGAVLGNLNLLQLQFPEGVPGRTQLANMEKAVRRASTLTRQLLAYSGKGHSDLRAIDPGPMLQDFAGLLELCVSRRSVLRLDLAPELPRILCDPVQIQQAIVDLVTNASEALDGEPGVITISARPVDLDTEAAARASHLTPARPGPHLAVAVSDTGHGMAPEALARIFEPFYSTKEHGRGLGLSAVRGILKGHGAGLEVESRPGAGSTFRLYLPVAPAGAGQAAPAPPAGPDRFRGRALVVDDEPVLLETAQAMLERLGLEVATACNGLQAMEYMASHGADLDLVLLDLAMPVMDGRQTFRAMRRLRPELPIILSSGNDPRRTPRDSAGRAARSFLRKPYTLDELRGALASALKPDLPAA